MSFLRIFAGVVALLLCMCAQAQRTTQSFSRADSWVARNGVWFDEARSNYATRYPVRVNGRWGYCDYNGRAVVKPEYDAAYPFAFGVGVVLLKDEVYAIDSAGRHITRTGHKQIRPLNPRLLAVYSQNDSCKGWGITDTSGKVLLPPLYDEVAALPAGILAFRIDTLWGYASSIGQLITEANYDTAYFTGNNLLVLRKGQFLGAVTLSGMRIAPDSCSDLAVMPQNNALAFRRGKYWGMARLADAERIIPCRFDTLYSTGPYFVTADSGDVLSLFNAFSGLRVAHGKYKRFFECGPGFARKAADLGKCGLVDTLGNEVLPEIYFGIEYALEQRWRVCEKNKWGLTNEKGKFVLPAEFEWISLVFRGSVIGKKTPLEGLYTKDGETIVAAANQEFLFRGNTIKAIRKDGNAVFVTLDENGKVIEKIDYTNMRTIKIGGDTRTPVRETGADWGNRPMIFGRTAARTTLRWFFKDAHWGVFDAFDGDTILAAQFDFINQSSNWGADAGVYTLVAKFESKRSLEINGAPTYSARVCGLFCDSSGKLVLPCTYPWINQDDANRNRFNGWVRCIRSDGQYGLVRIDGSETFMPFTIVENPLANGYARVCKGGSLSTSAQPGNFSLNSVSAFCTKYDIDITKSFPAPNNTTHPVVNQTLYITGGGWGYINLKAETVIKPVYQTVGEIRSGRCLFRENGKWGLTDSSGAVLVKPQYTGLRFTQENDTLLISLKYELRYGYTDTLGNELPLPVARKTLTLGQRLLALSINGKWAVYAQSGKKLTEEIYQAIEPFSEGLAAVQREGKWGFIDTAGVEVIAPQFQAVGSFNSARARVKVKNKWGFTDPTGQLVIDAVYPMVKDFAFGCAPVRAKTGWQLIDASGTAITKPAFRTIDPVKGSPCWVLRVAQLAALANAQGKAITPYIYDRIDSAGQGCVVARTGLKFSVLDTLGRVIYPPGLERAGAFANGLMPVRWRDGWGYINLNGKKLPGPLYRTADAFSEGKARVSFYDGRTGFIDTTGKVLFYTSRSVSREGFLADRIFIENGRSSFGYYVNAKGERIKAMGFAEGRSFYCGVAQVKAGNLWGIFSLSGHMLTPFMYAEMQAWNDGVAQWKRNTSFGLCTASGHEHLPVQYDYIAYASAGSTVMQIRQGNAVGYMRSNGTWLWPMQQ